MASPEVLDFERLLAPIPGASPAGNDIRLDPSPVSDYQLIRGARNTAREAEKRLDGGDPSAPTPDWKTVIFERSKAVLAGKSKDLEITAYLIEALVRLQGFAGLRDGFRLARGLVDQFWDGLFPALQEGDDVESRFAIILCLNGIDGPGTLLGPVRKIRITRRPGGEDLTFSEQQVALALSKVADPKVRERRVAEGALTIEAVQQGVAETPVSFLVGLLEDLAEARAAFLGFAEALKEKSGYDPPTSNLVEVLDAFEEAVRDLARDRLPKPAPVPDPVAVEADTGGAATNGGPATAAGGGPEGLRT
ncbi:MAG: type VI secretion system protein TssA, partial [Thermoleophilia bacterium]|nr:type VI secretion system protein TssA [Thermoleophilia bacterium]